MRNVKDRRLGRELTFYYIVSRSYNHIVQNTFCINKMNSREGDKNRPIIQQENPLYPTYIENTLVQFLIFLLNPSLYF